MRRRAWLAVVLTMVVAPAIAVASDQQIAYVKGNDIYLAYLDGSDPIKLTDDPEHPKRGLAWSGDGERLAYCRTRTEDKLTISDVYLITVSVPEPRLVVDGSKLEAPGNAVDFTGAWSPAFGHAGQFLYFVSGGGTEGGYLSRIDLPKQEFPAKPEQVKANRVFDSFTISRDGQAAGSFWPYYAEGGHHHEVCVAAAEQWEAFADISEPTGFDDAGDDYVSPAWSPDGKQIAAIHTRRDDIVLFHIADKTSRLFVDGDALDRLEITEIAWRPDGKGIFFTLYDTETRKSHSTWFAPLDDPYDRELIVQGAHSITAGGSVKLRSARAE